MRAHAVIIALLGFLPQVLTSGSFELRIKSFTNSLGRLSSGQCCDGSSSSDAPCLAPCRTKLRVCLKIYQANIDTTSPCTFGDITTPVLGGNSLDVPNLNVEGFSNPIVFPFDFTWPGTFSLIVEAWHDMNDTSRSDDSLIARMTKQSIADVGGPWVEEEQRWSGPGGAHLRLSYRVTCAPHYYGAGCEVLCRPRDDAFGHYTCSASGEIVCRPGWTGDYCSKPRCRPGCDAEHGHCLKPDECHCHTGWVGELCDQCERHPGCVHGTCSKPWDCICEEGWGGLFCNQDLNYCTNHRPCRNGGTCHNTGQGSFTCVCPPEYSGAECERALHSCEERGCLHGGRCARDEAGAPVCACPAGYEGARCETRRVTCADRPCQHGTCEPAPGGYTCRCAPGYGGADCELEADPCAAAPCRRGACVRQGDGHRCACPAGWRGAACEEREDQCAGVQCAHGGSCVELAGGARCHCAAGFVGPRCETRVDLCLTKPCANGGACSVLDNDYSCRCRPGFAGKDCSVDVDECASSPCRNGGTCQDRVDGFSCACAAGWRGATCAVSAAELAARPAEILRRTSEETEEGEERLSARHVALIAALSAAVPAAAAAAAVGVACVRRRRKRLRLAADAEARAQNAANAGGNRIRNSWGKCAAPAPECQNAHNQAAEECKRKTLNTESAARLLAALDPRLSQLSADSSYCTNSDTSLVKRALEGGGVYVLDDHCLPPTFATQV
ncbi:neurogenic locus protein delta [Plutella xylostella]|uniref:neurogenic locus protein delta n=1 Tax=Plutella xylostella TaxID=51655 RepID=UPI002032857C|nr:neurogenic locus protein delta [Plutella xylostella]